MTKKLIVKKCPGCGEHLTVYFFHTGYVVIDQEGEPILDTIQDDEFEPNGNPECVGCHDVFDWKDLDDLENMEIVL